MRAGEKLGSHEPKNKLVCGFKTHEADCLKSHSGEFGEQFALSMMRARCSRRQSRCFASLTRPNLPRRKWVPAVSYLSNLSTPEQPGARFCFFRYTSKKRFAAPLSSSGAGWRSSLHLALRSCFAARPDGMLKQGEPRIAHSSAETREDQSKRTYPRAAILVQNWSGRSSRTANDQLAFCPLR